MSTLRIIDTDRLASVVTDVTERNIDYTLEQRIDYSTGDGHAAVYDLVVVRLLQEIRDELRRLNEKPR